MFKKNVNLVLTPNVRATIPVLSAASTGEVGCSKSYQLQYISAYVGYVSYITLEVTEMNHEYYFEACSLLVL